MTSMEIIWDHESWRRGASKLSALGVMKVPIDFIPLDLVEHYHETIGLFEKATHKDLSSYRIDAKRYVGRPVPVYGIRNFAPSSVEQYCPAGYFSLQFNSFVNYVALFKDAYIGQHKQLEKEVAKMKEELSGGPKQQPGTSVTMNIGHMSQSNIVAASPGATLISKHGFEGPEFKALIKQIKDAAPSLGLEAGKKAQLDRDLKTIEIQLESPAPRYTIISESFNSTRAILEGLAANIITTGLMTAINAYLSSHG